jgi:hypothetical protein
MRSESGRAVAKGWRPVQQKEGASGVGPGAQRVHAIETRFSKPPAPMFQFSIMAPPHTGLVMVDKQNPSRTLQRAQLRERHTLASLGGT